MTESGHEGWAKQEFGGAFLGDERHIERLIQMATAMAQRPGGTVPDVFREPKEAKGAYRWLENERVEPADVASAAQRACAQRAQSLSLVLVPVDGSSWTFTDTKGTKGLGRIGSHTHGALGLKVMTAYALDPQGVPLGVLAQSFWTRSLTPCTVPHAQRALEDKESRWWPELLRGCNEAVGATDTAPTLWFQMDREADQVPVLLWSVQTSRPYVTVRVDDNRNLAAYALAFAPTSREAKLFDVLETLEAVGWATIRLRATPKRKARTARVEISFTSVSLRLRELHFKRHVADAPIGVVRVRELEGSCPPGAEPIEWILYTTYPVEDLKSAWEVVRCYALRWRIERFHFATKTGAGQLPHSQLESRQAIEKWAIVQCSVAARLEHILHRSRTEPDISALEEFSRDEIDGALALLRSVGARIAHAPGQTPTLAITVGYIARLGGYQGPSSGGPPGLITFRRGMERVEDAAVLLAALRGGGLHLQGASDAGKA